MTSITLLWSYTFPACVYAHHFAWQAFFEIVHYKQSRTAGTHYLFWYLNSVRLKLTLSLLGKILSRQHFEVSFIFFQKIRFDTSCKLSPKGTICMKYQSLFSGKKNKYILSICRLLNVFRGFVKVKAVICAAVMGFYADLCDLNLETISLLDIPWILNAF